MPSISHRCRRSIDSADCLYQAPFTYYDQSRTHTCAGMVMLPIGTMPRNPGTGGSHCCTSSYTCKICLFSIASSPSLAPLTHGMQSCASTQSLLQGVSRQQQVRHSSASTCLKSSGALVEVQRPSVLQQGTQDTGVGHDGQHCHRLLLAAPLQPLI